MGSPPPAVYPQADMAPEHYTLNRIMGAAIIVFLALVLFMFMFHLYARYLLRSRYSTSSLLRGHATLAPLWSQHGPVATGLGKATIALLPIFTYRAQATQETAEISPQMGQKNQALITECAICLSEFRDNEKGRLLPSCKHAFHVECIDMWFSSHSTCPLCRTDVVPFLEGDEQISQPAIEAITGASQQNNGPLCTQGNPGLRPTELSGDATFNGNQTHAISHSSSAKDPSCSHSSTVSCLGPFTHISIDIPISTGNSVLDPAPSLEPEACSSQPLSNLNLRLSFKRMLSRESSDRHSNSIQQGNEESQKTAGLHV